MKYLFIYWLFLMPICITAVNLEPWMPKASLEQAKAGKAKQESSQELMMNPLFIFK